MFVANLLSRQRQADTTLLRTSDAREDLSRLSKDVVLDIDRVSNTILAQSSELTDPVFMYVYGLTRRVSDRRGRRMKKHLLRELGYELSRPRLVR